MNNRSIDICLHVMACSQAGIEVSLDTNIFADGRCSWESVQLDLLCSSHRDRLFLYAQPCPWCSKWVSKESNSPSRSLIEFFEYASSYKSKHENNHGIKQKDLD